jgi:hypothetical protein
MSPLASSYVSRGRPLPTCRYGEASAAHLLAAAALYELVKRQFTDESMWVTASKLCARKRPQLIPVRDSVIGAGLGLPNRDYRQDWLIIGSVMEDADVPACLRRCGEAADPSGGTILAGVPELRLLDAVLWMRRPETAGAATPPGLRRWAPPPEASAALPGRYGLTPTDDAPAFESRPGYSAAMYTLRAWATSGVDTYATPTFSLSIS